MSDLVNGEKLPREIRYFNISTLWIPYYRIAIKVLFRLKIPHEAVTLLSILSGFASAVFYYRGNIVPGAIAFHLKDLFDAADGPLARMTGRGHLLGRYLDSVGDSLVINAVVLAILLRGSEPGNLKLIYWGTAALLSLFIQCSFFNYYQIKYLEYNGVESLNSKIDEKHRNTAEPGDRSYIYRGLLRIFRFLYLALYHWQDLLVCNIDNRLNKKGIESKRRYGNRRFMSLISPLCFGTHIFVIIVATLLGNVEAGFKFISVIMNIYLILLLYLRERIAL